MFRSIIGGVGQVIGHAAQNMWQSLFTDSGDSGAGVSAEPYASAGFNWRTGEYDCGTDPNGIYDGEGDC